mmetsp:Transcript_6369/g.13178  ORF Transcript_6369/g.13178 Transcript_6369/m.13178 type:complete len:217 (+) Transcript_6369:427-1077(+)
MGGHLCLLRLLADLLPPEGGPLELDHQRRRDGRDAGAEGRPAGRGQRGGRRRGPPGPHRGDGDHVREDVRPAVSGPDAGGAATVRSDGAPDPGGALSLRSRCFLHGAPTAGGGTTGGRRSLRHPDHLFDDRFLDVLQQHPGGTPGWIVVVALWRQFINSSIRSFGNTHCRLLLLFFWLGAVRVLVFVACCLLRPRDDCPESWLFEREVEWSATKQE